MNERKIFSFKLDNGITFNMPTIKDNTILDTIKHIGYNPNLKREYFSYIVDNVEFLDNDSLFEVKVYDNNNEEDLKELKELIEFNQEIKFELLKIESSNMTISKLSQLDILLAIADKNEKVIQQIRDIRNLQIQYLNDLGFSGISIFQ